MDTANICAVRDNLTKIAVTIDENAYGDGKKPIERLLGFLNEANNEKRGKYIGMALEYAKKKHNSDDIVSICVEDTW